MVGRRNRRIWCWLELCEICGGERRRRRRLLQREEERGEEKAADDSLLDLFAPCRAFSLGGTQQLP